MKRTGLRAAILAAVAALATAVLSTPATAAHAASGPAVHPLGGGAAEYWTPEKMRSARPLDGLMADAKNLAADVTAGVPRLLPSRTSKVSTGAPWTGGGAVTHTAGRVFFTFNGSPASCSGDAVTSANRSVVITAGHCVKYQGSWHTNWVFVPGYDNGSAPYGEWAATATLTTPQWQASEDLNYDVGAAVVAPLNGQYLTDVVGSQGIAFNQARGRAMYSFGYPAEPPYDGRKLTYCAGSTFNDTFGSNDLGMRCDMTGGSSGGPWLLNFNTATGAGVQNSVNSFGYTFLPGVMFGPYFGSDAEALYDTAQAR
ncbi:trypsin-like serine peptidase [Amycolatopsis thermophila]|uniref:V8-like Glu-specific endopeptidase n=1 Tax=Amycolatopsis thermophila TaxID=206084 RepID=A0ABU0EXF0_9PSEU|nr:peptidase [Amycolatopsis thermophila]MDQ0379946.1 V8-like Glu-specific endopeptidase [Amycolatopsis thermophila]